MFIALLYFLFVLGLIAGVAWMVSRTLRILFGNDVSRAMPAGPFNNSVAG